MKDFGSKLKEPEIVYLLRTTPPTPRIGDKKILGINVIKFKYTVNYVGL